MKKRTISKLKSIFGGKSKAKRHAQLEKIAHTPSPEPLLGSLSPSGNVFQPISPPTPTRVGPPPSPPVPTSPIAPVAPEPAGPLPLLPCAVCGRTFLPESLAKHVKICERTASKKRKTFDSSRQRREGTDLEQYLPKNFGLPENSPFLEKSPPNTAKTLPRQKSQSVRSAVTKTNNELQKCPHCNRAFGVRAFERHVEWCADKAKLLPSAPAQPPAHIADAKQRLNARTQYKAPSVRGRRSSQTRDKSSNSRSASVDSSRGISPPPPPPREYGDYKRGRTRASVSESVSSNEYHEEPPAVHVPVIRNARGAPVNSSGDAVKARQARLARDLSNSRLDDYSYDPFLSAARQMKELMSSDTNIPKKIQSTPKDSTRTLPMLRGTKDKSPPIYSRTDNTKMIKENLNKSYQKTPTLQRMKSFGSTHNEISNNNFGNRCSSFRLNRNDKKSNPKLNTTFTKSSKENISTTEKTTFNRNNSLNRSFSSYSTSSYSTPKPRDKIPKISTSMYHSFQRSTIKQPVKLDKIKKDDNKKRQFVNLDSILTDDNSSLADSNYIDPRLINENDNLPINVNTIRNNPDIISSMESLQTTENLPAKFESFTKNSHVNNLEHDNMNKSQISSKSAPSTDDLSAQYDKIMTSLERGIASKTSVRDDDSLCEDFDLEEFITSFDEELHKQMSENKRTCSSTTRIVKHALVDNIDSNIVSDATSDSSSPKVICNKDNNEVLPYAINKSNSLNFSNNNIATETLFPTPMKRSNSNIFDSLQKKKNNQKDEKCGRQRNHKVEQLEQDIMQSLKDFGKFYDVEKTDNSTKKQVSNHIYNGNATKRETPAKPDRKSRKYSESVSNGNSTPNGKHCNDSAYSSLNRISPSKLSLCPDKPNGLTSLNQIPAGSDSGGSHRENELRSVSSEEFLAMERSTELDAPLRRGSQERLANYGKEIDGYKIEEKRASSRASSRRSSVWRSRQDLSSSGSESSLHKSNRGTLSLPQRLSRFCHECGNKFPVDTAKFCIECGVKRLVV